MISELLMKYKQYSLLFKLYNPDLRGPARKFWFSSEFYKIVLVFLNEIEQSSGLSELLF